jgi:hypothetical protein
MDFFAFSAAFFIGQIRTGTVTTMEPADEPDEADIVAKRKAEPLEHASRVIERLLFFGARAPEHHHIELAASGLTLENPANEDQVSIVSLHHHQGTGFRLCRMVRRTSWGFTGENH